MEKVLLIITTLLYFSGTIGYLIYLLKGREVVHRVSWGVLLVGALLHACAIIIHSWQLGRMPVGNSREALSFFAWILVVTYLVAQVRLNLRILGSFVSPLAVIFMLLARILPNNLVPSTGVFKSAWVIFHVTVLFFANALFALAFSAGIMYLLQEHHIKRKDFGFFYMRLPSLERLDKINYICLVVGFPLMTIGLVTGFVYAGAVWHSLWNWDPKEIFSLITWFIYAILLHERLAVGWRGRRAAWLAIFGFSAVLITFLGVNLFMQGHHASFVR